MRRVVIVHENLGIFVGARRGIGYWSMYAEAGNASRVTTFDDEDEARAFIASWRPQCDPDDYSFVYLRCSSEWARVDELVKAGLEGMTEVLLLNMPVQGSA